MRQILVAQETGAGSAIEECKTCGNEALQSGKYSVHRSTSESITTWTPKYETQRHSGTPLKRSPKASMLHAFGDQVPVSMQHQASMFLVTCIFRWRPRMLLLADQPLLSTNMSTVAHVPWYRLGDLRRSCRRAGWPEECLQSFVCFQTSMLRRSVGLVTL